MFDKNERIRLSLQPQKRLKVTKRFLWKYEDLDRKAYICCFIQPTKFFTSL